MATARCASEAARLGTARPRTVPVEMRGAGPSTRQVTNFFSPEVWSHAEG